MTTEEFDDLRPYTDAEIPAAMQRIAASPLLPAVAAYALPGRDADCLRRQLIAVTTVDQFQREIMSEAVDTIIDRTVDTLTWGGLENLAAGTPYLYVSNHRDIMLDSAIQQSILYKAGHRSAEITFGANLMCHPLVVDIGRANKMFKIVREGNFRELYKWSLLHSEYIRRVITDHGDSVWIAQRNGRTKDGIDRTEPGLISMFASSGPADKAEALACLNIAPVAISYQWETCDVLKTLELYDSLSGRYEKKPGEDINSILTGVMARKGAVHVEFCKPVTADDLEPLRRQSKQDFVKAVACLIDSRINPAYRLHSTNYIACDILDGSDSFADRYSPQEKAEFEERMTQLLRFPGRDYGTLRNIFLGIYANPVKALWKD